MLPMKLSLMAWVTGILVICLVVGYGFIPRPELLPSVPNGNAWLDSEDSLLRFGLASDQQYRLYEKIENIAPELIKATILYEDQNFYEHSGVDFVALIRAFWTTYIVRQRRVGASTITMQVARLRWNISSSTLSGKLTQIVRALQLSRHFGKRDIMEAYLNLAPYGGNIQGIKAASLVYFDKKPSELNLLEALTLAVIPQNPNKRNPASKQGVKKSAYSQKQCV